MHLQGESQLRKKLVKHGVCEEKKVKNDDASCLGKKGDILWYRWPKLQTARISMRKTAPFKGRQGPAIAQRTDLRSQRLASPINLLPKGMASENGTMFG